MNKLNPTTLTKRLKIVYRPYATRLPLKFKLVILSILVLAFTDGVLGISNMLITNSKIDTAEKMIAAKPELPTTYMLDYKRNLANEYIHHKTIVDRMQDIFVMDKNTDESIPLLMTITTALFPIVMILILLYHLIEELIVAKPPIYHHVVNLSLSIAIFAIIAIVMRCMIASIPMLGGSWYWNYSLNAVLNISCFIGLLCTPPFSCKAIVTKK